MEILFKQDARSTCGLAEALGIKQCYFKRVYFERDRSKITGKRHFHTGFEIHMIERGYQVYQIDGKLIRVGEGELLLIPPHIFHIAEDAAADTVKNAISFSIDLDVFSELNKIECTLVSINEQIKAASDEVIAERQKPKAFCKEATALSVWRCIIEIFRAVGLKPCEQTMEQDGEDQRLSLAKEYVKDNVRMDISLSELSAYCGLGEKQLTRIFKKYEGSTPSEFIRKTRCEAIEELLSCAALSLKDISDLMSFNNEYYFNAFFKKNVGMSPGAYRKSVLKI